MARRRRRWWGAVAAAASLSQCASAQTVERGGQPLSLGEVRDALRSDVKVGSKRAGLVCAPAGSLRWRDVAPRMASTRVAIARALKDSGVAIEGPTDDWLDYRISAGGFRLIPAITALDMRACLPSYGIARKLGSNHRLKGEGVMQVEWRIYRMADRQIVARTVICAAFAFDAPGLSLEEASEQGLVANARLIGHELARLAPSLALPERLGLRPDQCPRLTTKDRAAEPGREDTPP